MKITNTGINKKEKQFYATFMYDKSNYMITWRPTKKESGVTFDIGILPVKEETDGSSKRVNGKKKQNETSTNGNA
jgi:hypothetical protein